MSDDLFDALRPVLTRLDAYLQANPAVRADMHVLAQAAARWLAPPVAPEPPAVILAPAPVVAEVAPAPPPPPPPPPSVAIAKPTVAPVVVARPVEEPEHERELVSEPPGVIAARCRVKADAAKLVADRLGNVAGNTLLADLISRAKTLPDCFLWMLQTDEYYSESRTAWGELAEAYQTAAAAADMLRTWFDLPAGETDRYKDDVLPLAAEAQSTLYSATQAVGHRGYDQDQLELFVIVREEAKERQVFIRRFLRREDRADPAAAAELGQRVRDRATLILDRTARAAAQKKALNNLRYKLNRLRSAPQQGAEEWPRVFELIDRLVADGYPPSSTDLRELILPVLDQLPDVPELPKGVALMLREIGRYQDTRPEAEDEAEEAPSAEVQEVARLIGGRTLVLIGGQARPQHRAALIRAFDLADLDWIVTPEHESYHVFEPAVARPETAVVILAIRWSSHSYSEVSRYCELYDKPLVRLPAGYNANQMAHQILSQVGDRLRDAVG